MRILYTVILFTILSCKSKQNTPIDNSVDTENIEIFNVKNFGAKGDNSTDDTKAIQNCFQAIEKNGSGTAYFPNGVYKISRTNIAGKAWCLKGINNFTIKGENKDSTSVKLAPKQKNFTRMLVLENNNFVNITNITFDGNLSNQVNPKTPNEHLGGVFIDHSNNVSINNSNFINTGGDGIGIRGVKTPSKNIIVTNCFFDNNQRNGLTLGSGFDGVVIKNNEFGFNIDDSPIDTEPNSGICQNVLIENNLINTPSLLTLGGAKDNNPGRNFIVRNNTLNDCSIFMVNADSVVIKNNKLIITKSKKSGITCLGSNRAIYIEDNDITIKNRNAFYFVKTQHSRLAPRNIHVINNLINVSGNVNAFDIRGANHVFIEKNIITGNNSNNGIYVFSNYKMNGLSINNNIIKGFKTGIKIVPLKKNNIHNLAINKNTFQSTTNTSMKTAIDVKYHGRKELDLLKNLKIDKNTYSKGIIKEINR